MKGVKLLVLSIVAILFTYSAQAQCRIYGWSYMANKTTACDSFRTFNVVIMDSPLVYKPGTIGQVMILGPNKKVTTSAIGSVLKARNGLTISNDTLYLGGTLSLDSTGIGFNPRYKKLFFGNDTAFYFLGTGGGAPAGTTVFGAFADIASLYGYSNLSLISQDVAYINGVNQVVLAGAEGYFDFSGQLNSNAQIMQLTTDSLFTLVSGKMSTTVGTTYDVTSQQTLSLFSPVSAGLNSYTNSDRQQASIVANNGGFPGYPAVISECRVLGQYAAGFYAQVDTSNNSIFSNIYAGYFGEDSIRDITQWWVQVDKIHGRLYLDTVTSRYNGAEIRPDYVQLEIDKDGEDGSGSGELWRGGLHDGYGLWSSGTNKFNIDTIGNVDFLGSDSASIYSLTPSKITLAACNNCSGNGIVGRLLVYLNGLWYQLGLTPP